MSVHRKTACETNGNVFSSVEHALKKWAWFVSMSRHREMAKNKLLEIRQTAFQVALKCLDSIRKQHVKTKTRSNARNVNKAD
jgi:hypothetical protein